jgi:hypothetical protein
MKFVTSALVAAVVFLLSCAGATPQTGSASNSVPSESSSRKEQPAKSRKEQPAKNEKSCAGCTAKATACAQRNIAQRQKCREFEQEEARQKCDAGLTPTGYLDDYALHRGYVDGEIYNKCHRKCAEWKPRTALHLERLFPMDCVRLTEKREYECQIGDGTLVLKDCVAQYRDGTSPKSTSVEVGFEAKVLAGSIQFSKEIAAEMGYERRCAFITSNLRPDALKEAGVPNRYLPEECPDCTRQCAALE